MRYKKSKLLSGNSLPFLTVAMGACGKKGSQDIDKPFFGFSPSYVAPEADYDQPNKTDPNFKLLEPTFVQPYWVNSLEMDQGKSVVSEILNLDIEWCLFRFLQNYQVTFLFPYRGGLQRMSQ